MTPRVSTRVAAVIGSPVRHSLSPALHNAAFEQAGLDWTFVAFEVPHGAAAAAVAAMRALGIRGLSVTMPHKEDVAAAADTTDAGARELRSANTALLRDDGTTLATSTDGAGFVQSLRAAGVDPQGCRVVVLGAGAAARSIVHALGGVGASDVAIVNRSARRATETAALADVARVAESTAITGADIVVNATSVGMGSDESPCDPELLRPQHVVADIVYHPLDTALLRAARSAGAHTVDGLGMLVHQAVLQHELWTGCRPDPAVMRASAEAELAAPGR